MSGGRSRGNAHTGESLGGQSPSAAALMVGTAKARTHSGKRGFHLVVLKEGCLWATRGRREIQFHCLLTCENQSSAKLSLSSQQGGGGASHMEEVCILLDICSQDPVHSLLKHLLPSEGPGPGPEWDLVTRTGVVCVQLVLEQGSREHFGALGAR